VFAWDNLFPAADQCQGNKRERFDDPLLRPDASDYRFERYFLFNCRTGEIEVLPGAPAEDRAAATTTVEILGLNRGRRPNARRREFRDRGVSASCDLDDRPYRFLPCGSPAKQPD
jgi:hypothetical protein